jgi:acyl carrier protein
MSAEDVASPGKRRGKKRATPEGDFSEQQKQFLELVAVQLGIDDPLNHMETPWVDLPVPLESLDIVELVVVSEEEFGILIEDDRWVDCENLDQLWRVIVDYLAERPHKPRDPSPVAGA